MRFVFEKDLTYLVRSFYRQDRKKTLIAFAGTYRQIRLSSKTFLRNDSACLTLRFDHLILLHQRRFLTTKK